MKNGCQKQSYNKQEGDKIMIDATNELFNIQQNTKIGGGKTCRFDMIQSRLENIRKMIDPTRPILIQIKKDDEIIKKGKGTYEKAVELAKYYNDIYVIRVTGSKAKNAITINLERLLNKPADDDLDDKKKNKDEDMDEVPEKEETETDTEEN